MEYFPGTEDAWYLSIKEKLNRVIEEFGQNTIELPEFIENIPPEKIKQALRFILEILSVERKAIVDDIMFSPKLVGRDKIKDIKELEKILIYMELILQAPREDFRLFEGIPCPIYGDLKIEYHSPLIESDKNITLNEGKKIFFIDPLMYLTSFIGCKADKVIVTQFDLDLLIENQVDKKLNAILVGLGYLIPRSTRNILRKLSIELNLPVYVLTEATPNGLQSSIDLIKGPIDPSPQFLVKFTVPHALWVGVSVGDISEVINPRILDNRDEIIIKKIKANPISKSEPYTTELKYYEEKKYKFNIEQVEKINVVKYLSNKIP